MRVRSGHDCAGPERRRWSATARSQAPRWRRATSASARSSPVVPARTIAAAGVAAARSSSSPCGDSALGQVDDQRAHERVGAPPAAARRGGGAPSGPPRRTSWPARRARVGPVEAHDVGGAGPGAGEGVERWRARRRAAPGRRRRGPSRWPGGRRPARTAPASSAQRGPQGGGDDRRRHRPPARAGERRGAQQLGQAVGGDEGDGGEARRPAARRPERARRQQPPGGHADVVRRHDDRDGCQRLVALDRRDVAAERGGGRPSVCHPLHVQRHGQDCSDGVSQGSGTPEETAGRPVGRIGSDAIGLVADAFEPRGRRSPRWWRRRTGAPRPDRDGRQWPVDRLRRARSEPPREPVRAGRRSRSGVASASSAPSAARRTSPRDWVRWDSGGCVTSEGR